MEVAAVVPAVPGGSRKSLEVVRLSQKYPAATQGRWN